MGTPMILRKQDYASSHRYVGLTPTHGMGVHDPVPTGTPHNMRYFEVDAAPTATGAVRVELRCVLTEETARKGVTLLIGSGIGPLEELGRSIARALSGAPADQGTSRPPSSSLRTTLPPPVSRGPQR